jgi:hypothetical protein
MKYENKYRIAVFNPLNNLDDDYFLCHWETFQSELAEEFDKFRGFEVHVIGRNMGWQKLTGHKTFELEDAMDIFEKIKPDVNELTFYLYKMGTRKYFATISHHDAMRETYEIELKEKMLQ